MANTKAVLQPDLVLITWSKNPLVVGSARRIVASRVIGSSRPCTASLAAGTLLSTALACLLDNDIGFKIVFRKKTSSISGYLLLQRKS
ncbi:hypothetical protein [Paenibacillus sacheonensis]|uniref:Uncharacterized protein n=1 Tax=Paenibacillus sacheonensis TaxID=742054 RepID=A0A7X4YLP4_9BACL|nr:hypothetical protein [Paenibacillus sacheonensis]MBM7563904.1 hypothetical protein [Paenibacillus sacheonensis]NBC67749.1 hypothetical protein [Paenibacillus sacheonensis]